MSDTWLYLVPPTVKWQPVTVVGAPTLYSSGVQVPTGLVSGIQTEAAALGVALSINTPPSPSPDQILTTAEADGRYAPLVQSEIGTGGLIYGGNADTATTAGIINGGSA